MRVFRPLLTAAILSGCADAEIKARAQADTSRIPDSAVMKKLETPTVPAPIASGGPWTVTIKPSEMGDDPIVAVSTHADLTDDMLRGDPELMAATLLVRCMKGERSVILRSGGMFDATGNESRVRLRFDDAPAGAEVWSEATDFKALFSPSPGALMSKMKTAKLVRIEFTPFHGSPTALRFSLVGFDTSVVAVERACAKK